MTKTELQAVLRDMWATRPARPPDDRQVAGVAAAIARRYDVDPVLVRVGFAVAAFAGIGALLYIAGWIALPDGATPTARPSRRVLPTIALAVAAVVSIGSVAWLDVSALVAGVVAVGLLVLLHHGRAHIGTPGALAGAPHGAAGAGPWTVATGAAGDAAPAAPGDAPLDERRPPAWDPLGVAPYAWDLPEPPPPPSPAPGPRVTAVTLAAALLAGGLTGLVLLLTGGGVAILFGVLLAVLGTGLLVGAFRNAGRGLIPVALVIVAITWAVVSSPFSGWDGRVGDQRFAPRTAAEVQPSYAAGVGTFELDLRGIDLAVPPGAPAEPVRTAIRGDAGDVQVLVAPTADVTLHGTVSFGNIEFADRADAGPDARLDVTDLGTDGVASGRPIVLDVTAGAGNVEVRRG